MDHLDSLLYARFGNLATFSAILLVVFSISFWVLLRVNMFIDLFKPSNSMFIFMFIICKYTYAYMYGSSPGARATTFMRNDVTAG